ncbi:hypothetical protein M407DRAFT_236844 [Tulasnella calospora MUT 4182]|uniref:BTB domain-containing protein n=1 Tax=Tulasnella calospora MUT 4182 TaxID=1051891 RepID=A0A0C3QGU9_9AGAM|nr:hypothetical protein M407DRAFT_236844 [Tulasnella calospora MUT 4182]
METDRKSIHSVIEATGPPQELPDLAASTLLIHGKRYRKHEHHWYEEGNFGFLVGDIAFRLHRSILSRRSSVISDMFRTPQPLFPIPEISNSGDNVIGVPFMELQDRAEDFAHVLDFIYPNSLPAAQTGHLGVKDLMGTVRFTGKYLIDDLKEWAISALDARLLPSAKLSLKALRETPSLYADSKFCVEIVQFSRECSLPKFLPLAFYALATAEWDQIPGGVSCLDQLSSQDRARVHEGRLALNKAVLEKVVSLSEKLPRREDCTQGDCKPMEWVNPSIRWKGLMLHPLEELEVRIESKFAKFCVDCKKNVVNKVQAVRDDLMVRLTEFFKLESTIVVTNGTFRFD